MRRRLLLAKSRSSKTRCRLLVRLRRMAAEASMIAKIDWSDAPDDIRRSLDFYRNWIAAFAGHGDKRADQVIRLMAALCDCDEATIRRTVKCREADR